MVSLKAKLESYSTKQVLGEIDFAVGRIFE